MPFQSYWTWLWRKIGFLSYVVWVAFLRMFWNFISSLLVKRGGPLSILVGTISNCFGYGNRLDRCGERGIYLSECNTSFSMSPFLFSYQYLLSKPFSSFPNIIHDQFTYDFTTSLCYYPWSISLFSNVFHDHFIYDYTLIPLCHFPWSISTIKTVLPYLPNDYYLKKKLSPFSNCFS